MTNRAKTTAASTPGSFAPDLKAEPHVSLNGQGSFASETVDAMIADRFLGQTALASASTDRVSLVDVVENVCAFLPSRYDDVSLFAETVGSRYRVELRCFNDAGQVVSLPFMSNLDNAMNNPGASGRQLYESVVESLDGDVQHLRRLAQSSGLRLSSPPLPDPTLPTNVDLFFHETFPDPMSARPSSSSSSFTVAVPAGSSSPAMMRAAVKDQLDQNVPFTATLVLARQSDEPALPCFQRVNVVVTALDCADGIEVVQGSQRARVALADVRFLKV